MNATESTYTLPADIQTEFDKIDFENVTMEDVANALDETMAETGVTIPTPIFNGPRIYVASLADYNNGHLLGRWIDLDGKDADDVQAEIAAMLRTSRFPNVMVEDEDTGEMVPSAEEWSIHDFAGFYGVNIPENPDLSTIVELAEALEDASDPEALAAYIANFPGDDLDVILPQFSDAYQGTFDTREDYARQLLDDTGDLESIPERLRYYFDYESFARDLFMDGFWSARTSEGLAVFADI